MGEKDKTILIVIIAFVVMAVCLIASCCAAAFFVVSRADRQTIIDALNESSSSSMFTARSEGAVQSAVDDSGGLSEAELSVIEVTEKVRGLSAQTKMAPVYENEEELRSYLIEQLKNVTDDELEDELALYNILGFAPKDFDLRQFYIDMYSEQIAGFYDPDTNQMYLIESSPYDNAVTLAHEYTHYLQYNNPDFPILAEISQDDDYCTNNGEVCIVIDALIEGDATLTESLVDIDSLIGKYRNDSENSSSDSGSSVFNHAPKYFQDSLLFPYMYGYDFVVYQYMKGGFDKVNEVYTNLPQSVEQIMHPEKYLIDEPVNVETEPFRSIITEDFDIIQEDVLNEEDILMILGSGYNVEWQLSERQVKTAAEGWGGGAYIFAEDDDKPLFFSKTVWDTIQDAEEAETVFALYSDRRFGELVRDHVWKGEDGESVYLIRQDDVLYWLILPDNFDSESFVDLIQNGSAL